MQMWNMVSAVQVIITIHLSRRVNEKGQNNKCKHAKHIHLPVAVDVVNAPTKKLQLFPTSIAPLPNRCKLAPHSDNETCAQACRHLLRRIVRMHGVEFGRHGRQCFPDGVLVVCARLSRNSSRQHNQQKPRPLTCTHIHTHTHTYTHTHSHTQHLPRKRASTQARNRTC